MPKSAKPRASKAANPDRALLLRAVKWARLPGHGNRVAEACARYGLTASQYRRGVKEVGDEAVLCSDEDYVLSGLAPGGPTTVESLIYYYSWTNHAGMKPDEMVAVLQRLIAKGLVRQVGDKYEIAVVWP